MSPRVLLVALVLAASATFVIGVALERSGESSHHETRAESSTHHEQAASGEQAEGGERATEHAAETGGAATGDGDAVAVAMLAFAALDAREIAHQIDIDKSGMAILAGAVAVLHLAAAAVAASMALHARRPQEGLSDRADTMAA